MTSGQARYLPEHIAIIMDGNNRWAKGRGLPVKTGHRHGAATAREIVFSCVRRKIPCLTLFAFSSENWMRPSHEVQGLMALFLSVLRREEINQLHKANVRLSFIGNRESFSARIQNSMVEVEKLTRDNSGTRVTVAADYGGRWDIANAMRLIAAEVRDSGLSTDSIDIDLVHSFTQLSELPEPDLCIRTGGERRISNFLLWQFAYTEFYFTECLWPDFDETELQQAIDDFASRQRRFGGHVS
ncbi:MAG: polyprenyl diphosphate synthase [Gammaproteobacteria bacterium]|nr:polyprenyl diphosphate synthase [Gammaproteobacteria bacterium]MDE0480224.1 polyprenyl diphosphate synthase [Gammaproteobacteria bacterium]MXX07328.1 di-trans,poly-cis-decaprenylcistransferase [Gammaproteobacteria bacterium]MYA35117.1 di-trans,poly-cis-decaprenylcistransferase [Gammaproteobacteria bacterium]MYA66296.1 di-trans,poly-cis-decaprenylcistransferase [Gammaproteobacteria bacterium]